jgi:anti-sigma B factor antagonist
MTIANEVDRMALLPRQDLLHVNVQAIHRDSSNIGTSWVIHVSGSVDWTTSSQLRAQVGGLIRSVGPARVVVDLAGVTHLDSSGIGALMASLRDANQKHVRFLLAALNGSLRRLLERTQLHTVFDIRSSVQDALRA